MKFLFFPVLFFTLFARAEITTQALTTFAQQNSYKDNRTSLQKDKAYNAFKKGVVLEAFPGPQGFKQVALYCDKCGVSEIDSQQRTLCQSEFASLYKTLSGEDLDSELKSKMNFDMDKPLNFRSPSFRLRTSTGLLKCDTQGGLRLRIDVFEK